MQTISATDLARNTREILDKVASRGEIMVVERNHIMIAKIVPPERAMTAHQALAGLRFPLLTSQNKPPPGSRTAKKTLTKRCVIRGYNL